MKKGVKVLSSALFLLVFHATAEMRTWTSVKGDSIEAEYVSMFGGKVVLKTSEGKQLKVPLGGLCDADQEYLIGAIPPKLEITVDVDVDRDKQGNGFTYETTEETCSISVTVKKINKEKSNRKFKVRVYLIAEAQRGPKRQLIGYEMYEFSFLHQKIATFSASGGTASAHGYSWSRGFEYEGYLVCIEDEKGKIVSMKSNKNHYKKWVQNLKRANKNDLLAENLTVAN